MTSTRCHATGYTGRFEIASPREHRTTQQVARLQRWEHFGALDSRVLYNHPGMCRPAIWVPFVVLCAGAWLRLVSHDQVFAAGTVLPVTSDATYHLYRSLRTYAAFPHAPVFDPLMNWPDGAYAHLADGYDELSALAAKLFAPGGDEVAAAGVMVHVPIAMGLLTALLAVGLARALTLRDPRRSLITVSSWVAVWLLPQGIFISLLGATDHHVLEAAAAAGLALWTLQRYPLPEFGLRPLPARLRFELTGAATITAAMWGWNAAQLYAALASAMLFAASLLDRGIRTAPAAGVDVRDAPAALAGTSAPGVRDSRRGPTVASHERGPVLWLGSGAPALLIASAATLLLYSPNIAQHGEWLSYARPSALQPAVLALLGGLCAAATLTGRLVGFAPQQRFPWQRLLACCGLCLCLVIPLAAIAPLRDPVVNAISQQLLRGEASMTSIEEAAPLFRGFAWLTREGWATPVRDFGAFGPLSLLLLPLALNELRRAQPGRTLVFGFWCATLILLACIEQRFTRPLWPLLAVWSAAGVCALARPRAQLQGTPLRFGSVLALGMLVLAVADVSWLRRWRTHPSASQLASVFLSKANLPRADGTRAGALAPWDLGHALMWPAKTGVVANGFLFHLGRELLERSERALATREGDALALMRERDLDWLVVGAGYYAKAMLGPSHLMALRATPEGPVVEPRFLAKVPISAAMLGGSGIPELGVPHFEHLAPRWASAGPMTAHHVILPELWVYERVRGAALRGKATPNALVVARLALRIGAGELPLTASTRADGSGSFTLRVAAWCDNHEGSLATGPRWLLEDGTHSWSVQVAERDVREGHALECTPPQLLAGGESRSP